MDNTEVDVAKQEREVILKFIEQLSTMHSDNKQVISVLTFLKDLIHNREEN